jgi:competence protein ComFC
VMTLRNIARLIAPPPCVVCGHEGQVVCRRCVAGLVVPQLPLCFWCGASSFQGRTCIHCWPVVALQGLVVASAYAGAVHDLIGLLKYHRQRDAATVLAATLTPLLDPTRFDVVTSVPVATSRLRQRGYNQSELIAQSVARVLALPYRPLLRRLRNTQQVGKSRHQRLEQVGGLFVARVTSPLRILIIDDVLTTGATLNSCAVALQAVGATEVWGAVVARD